MLCNCKIEVELRSLAILTSSANTRDDESSLIACVATSNLLCTSSTRCRQFRADTSELIFSETGRGDDIIRVQQLAVIILRSEITPGGQLVARLLGSKSASPKGFYVLS